MFSAFKSSFSSGIRAKYSLSQNPQFKCGPWSVYKGRKKSEGTASPPPGGPSTGSVSVFVFDKRALTAYLAESGVTGKPAVEEVCDRLRREVAAMAKMRHPSIVKIIEPLEESKGSLLFVTEPLTACLKSLIDNKQAQSVGALESGDLDELVIQRGLLQVIEALTFLHQHAGMVHLDVQPSSIVVDAKGDWKMGGLGFIQSFTIDGGQKDYFLPQYDPRLPSFVQINLDYSAPELVLDHRLDPSNDIFALGCLILAIYNGHSPLSTNNNPSAYKDELPAIQRALRSQYIPQYVSNVLPRLLARQSLDRITLDSLRQSEFFDNPLVRTINFLDNFSTSLPSEKKVFLTGLYPMLNQFPKSVLQRKVLQVLLDDLGTDEALVYALFKVILAIGSDMSQLGFSEKILPAIRKVEKEPGCHAALLDNLSIFLSRLTVEEFKKYILPILMLMLRESEADKQKEVLVKIDPITEKLDFVSIKNDVFPAVSEVFGKTTSLAVKLESLKALRVLIDRDLDKYVITEKLLPLLSKMKTREPEIILAALEVYSSLAPIVDIELLATSVIPQILSLSLESSLTVDQFGSLMKRVRAMLDRIEEDRKKKLVRNLPQRDDSLKPAVMKSKQSSEPLDFNSLISGSANSNASRPRTTPALSPTSPSQSDWLSQPNPPVQAQPVQASFATTQVLRPSPANGGSLHLQPSRSTFGSTSSSGTSMNNLFVTSGNNSLSNTTSNFQSMGLSGSTNSGSFQPSVPAGTFSAGNSGYSGSNSTTFQPLRPTPAGQALRPTQARPAQSGQFPSFQSTPAQTNVAQSVPPLLAKPNSSWSASNNQPKTGQKTMDQYPSLI